MTRHIFALLALLSGLAAISHPVHAQLAEASAACDASVEAQAHAEQVADHRAVKVASEAASQREAKQAEETVGPLPEVLRLPVMMGVDRAYE